MIYFTSDLHLGHNKPFMYEPRGFKSIQEHDKAIIDNINSIVTNEDDLYILGDIIMGDQDRGIELLKSINGKKTIIKKRLYFGNKFVYRDGKLYF